VDFKDTSFRNFGLLEGCVANGVLFANFYSCIFCSLRTNGLAVCKNAELLSN